jgi:hypothetical protein
MKWVIIALLVLGQCAPGLNVKEDAAAESSAPPANEYRIRGVSLTAAASPMTQEVFDDLTRVGADYVCLLPFAFMRSKEPKIYFNTNRQWWGERLEGVAACIQLAHQAGLRVMVKPQIWMHNSFTGDIRMETEEQWQQLEQNYRAYIFSFLRVADSLHAEIFCLGTELDSFVKLRPRFWSHLIDSAREVYDGKLTYAENWDCYHDFPFWQKLDYIGINAYFPLSHEATPTVSVLEKGWKKFSGEMKALNEKEKRPVLFTEFGYRSVDYCAREPWDAYAGAPKNFTAQQNAYESLFRECWNEPWFDGGFCWKWFDKNTEPDVSHETDYTPQEKPAEEVLRQWYSGARN